MSAEIRKTGFTLIELMVTLVVAGLLLAVGVPGFIDMYKNNRLATASNSLATAVNLARSEAIVRGVGVTICKRGTGTVCDASGVWSDGWLIFTDEGVDQTYDAGSDVLIRVFDPLASGVVVTGTLKHYVAGAADSTVDYVSFDRFGRSDEWGTISFCDDRTGNYGLALALGTDPVDVAVDPDGVVPNGRLSTTRGVTCP